MNKYQKGEILEPLLILVGLIIIMVVYIFPNKSSIGPISTFNTPSNGGGSGGSAWGDGDDNSFYTSPEENSSYSKYVNIGIGNASYETDAIEEYITLGNNGDTPVTITGWRLTNGKDRRPFIQNGKTVVSAQDNVSIPNGTTYLSATGLNSLSPIVLKNNETAIITTGFIGPRSDIPIVSFKENKCSGYLEEDAGFTFTPSIQKNCIYPKNEPGVAYLDTKCQDFIENMGSCHIPKFETRDRNGELCRDCVDGVSGLSKSCIAYLREHYNYAGCLANHSSDADFLKNEWRIFLGNKFELWVDRRETISLFDQFGKLVDYRSY